MTLFQKFLRLALCGGRTPAAGSVAARRLALIQMAYRPTKNGAAMLVGTLIFVAFMGRQNPWMAPVVLPFIFAINGAHNFALRLTANHPEADFIAGLPVSRKELFACFHHPGALGLLLISCVAGALQLAHFGISPGTLHLVWAMAWVPFVVFTTPFTNARLTNAVMIISLGVIVVTAIPVGLIVAGFGAAAEWIFAPLHGLVSLGLMVTIFLKARANFFINERDTGASVSLPPAAKFAVTPVIPSSPKPEVKTTETTLATPRVAPVARVARVATTSVIHRSRLPAAAQRRAALLRLAYDGAQRRSLWFAGIWLGLLFIAPAVIQLFIHLLFTALFMEYVVNRRWKWIGGNEFAHLLPASRSELLLVRVLPLLALQFLMATLGLFFTGVIHAPEFIWGRVPLLTLNSPETAAAAFIAGPVAFGVVGILGMVWPKQVGAVGRWAGIGVILMPQLLKISIPWPEITVTRLVVAGTVILLACLGAALVDCRRREFAVGEAE